MSNNQKNNYIILKYNNNGYNIIIHSDNQTQKLNPSKAKIMRKVLYKYKPYQINEDTYLYHKAYSILLSYEKELIKNKLKVNRQKSANIALSIVLTASLVVGGYSIYDYVTKNSNNNQTSEDENNDLSENLKELIQKLIEKSEINDNLEEVTQIKKAPIKEENIEIDANEYIDAYYYDENPGDKEALIQCDKYDDLFLKYERRYGIDAELLKAISAQESSGKQENTNGRAFGLAGIENTRAGDIIYAYNFETGQKETITVDFERAKTDIDYNVAIRAANLNEFFDVVYNSNLIPKEEILFYTLQRDNMGAKTMQDILKTGEYWIDARKKVPKGDPNYYENVLSRLKNDTVITLRKRDGSYFCTTVTNTYTKSNTPTRS